MIDPSSAVIPMGISELVFSIGWASDLRGRRDAGGGSHWEAAGAMRCESRASQMPEADRWGQFTRKYTPSGSPQHFLRAISLGNQSDFYGGFSIAEMCTRG